MKTSLPLPSWLLAVVLGLSLSACDSTSVPVTTPVSPGGGSTTGGTPPSGGTGSNPGTTANRLPLALPDNAIVQAGSTSNPIAVLLNDQDLDGDTLTLTAVSLVASLPPASGQTLALAPDGRSLRYSPPTGFVGTQTLRYTVSDGRGGLATALAVVTVSPLALPPAALPDVFTKLVDAPVSVLDVLANDHDGAGGGLTVTQASSVATVPPNQAGTVSVVSGALRYQPRAGFTGVETLSYTLRDANGATATATVLATVLPLAAPPVALPDLASTLLNTAQDLDVLANDVDLAGGGLTLSAVEPLASLPPGSTGAFSVVANRLHYSPGSPSFVGTETARYTVTDANGATATGLVTLLVTPALPAIPPVAVPDVATVAGGSTSATLSVRSNDIDPAAGGLTVTAASVVLGLPNATGVTASTDGAGVQLTLPANYSGVLTLSYTIADANGSTATAAALVTVTPAALPALPPLPVPDIATVTQDSAATVIPVLANDVDPAGGGLTVTAVSTLASLPAATHTVSHDGSAVSFTPTAGFAGVVTLRYTARGANNLTAEGLVTVTVTPALLTLPPVALPDVLTVAQGAAATTADVLANDVDPHGSLALSGVSVLTSLPVATHTVSHGPAGVSFTPAVGFAGVVTLSYTALDGLGRSTTGLLAVTVTPALTSGLPLALPDVLTLAQDSVGTLIPALGNDVNPNAGGLTLTSVQQLTSLPAAAHTLGLSGNQLLFTPAAGFAGVVTGQYTATDALGNVVTGLVALTVVPPSPVALPAAVGDVGSLLAGLTASFDVLGNDIDPAGGGLTLLTASFNDPVLALLGGAVTVVANQAQLSLPLLGVVAGVLPISYTAVDSLGRTVNGVLNVTLIP